VLETNTLTSTVPGRNLVQEITPDANSVQAQRLLGQRFLAGSCNYRGLVLKYHTTVDTETGKKLCGHLPDVPTRPVSMQTANIVERLTGLCLQLGLLTLETLDNSIRSGGFYEHAPAHGQPFTPLPELQASLDLLLTLEAIPEHERRIRALVALNQEDWKRYLILHKARNKVLVKLLGDLPGLIPDSTMRTWFMVMLNDRMPTWVTDAGGRRSKSFLFTQLNIATPTN